MSTLTAQDVLDICDQRGLRIELNEDFGLDVYPASKLQPEHLEMLRSEKPKLVEHLARQAAKDLLLAARKCTSMFNVYHDHHFKCPQCVAAGQGFGKRCIEGKPLWFRYQLESYCD